jgi:hypothetical protein
MMPKTQGPFWESRDFDTQDIPCRVEGCPANSYGTCIMPSCIKIRPDGRCEMAVKEMQLAKVLKGDVPTKKNGSVG